MVRRTTNNNYNSNNYRTPNPKRMSKAEKLNNGRSIEKVEVAPEAYAAVMLYTLNCMQAKTSRGSSRTAVNAREMTAATATTIEKPKRSIAPKVVVQTVVNSNDHFNQQINGDKQKAEIQEKVLNFVKHTPFHALRSSDVEGKKRYENNVTKEFVEIEQSLWKEIQSTTETITAEKRKNYESSKVPRNELYDGMSLEELKSATVEAPKSKEQPAAFAKSADKTSKGWSWRMPNLFHLAVAVTVVVATAGFALFRPGNSSNDEAPKAPSNTFEATNPKCSASYYNSPIFPAAKPYYNAPIGPENSVRAPMVSLQTSMRSVGTATIGTLGQMSGNYITSGRLASRVIPIIR